MQYLGDIVEDATIRGSFNTRTAAGVPITLGGTPALSVYKDAGTTESTAGVTLTVDFDSRTGHHVFTIDTSANAFYATGSDYRVVITTGTVDGTSVVGTEVGSFSIENRNTKANVTQVRGDSIVAQKLDLFVTNLNSIGGFTVDSFGGNCITDDAISATAVTKIQNGLATALQVETFVAASELNLESLLVDIPTVAEFNARTLPSADYFVVSDYTAPDNAGIAANGVAIGNVPTLAEIEASTVLAKEATVAAKASQASVDTKPTLSQIEASTILAKEATVDDVMTEVGSKPTLLEIEASTVLAKETSVTNRPTLAQIEASTILAKEATVESKASQTSVDGKPSLAQIEASTVLAKEATVLTVASYLDTEMAAVKAVTDKLNTTVELDGLVYRFTINALEQAPSGGGGGGDPWNTELPGSYTGDQAGKLLSDIASATSTGRVTVVSPVAEQGRVFPLVIGDDYLVDNDRALEWTTPEITGIDIEDATCRFWILKDETGYSWEGTVGPGSSGYWVLSVEITNDSWEDAEPGVYEYGVEVIDTAHDQQITVVISSKDGGVRLRRKE
jgi:hypothetical protein